MNKEEKKQIKWFREDLAEEKENCGKYNDYQNQVIKRNEKILNLIKKQQKEIDKQNKMIDELLQELTDDEFDNPCTECCKECEKDNDTLFNCIKQYFIRKAEEDDNSTSK